MTSRSRRICFGSAVKRLGPSVLSALQVWLWLIVFVFQNEFRIAYGIQPGYLDFDNLPETNFTCAGKVIGGYYADLETSCQMFHVCTIGQENEPMDIKFLCLNGTVFDQETRVCERVDEVDCSKSEKFYSLNLELYGSTLAPIIEPEDGHITKPDLKQDLKENAKVADEHDTMRPETNEDNREPEEENPEEGEIEYEYDTEDPPTTQRPSTTQRTTTTNKARQTTTMIPPTKTEAQTDPSTPPQTTIVTYHKPNIAYGPPNRQEKPTDGFVSPQEFIYRHGSQKDKNPEAISFQRQTFPGDGHNPLTVTTHNIEHHTEKKPHQSIVEKIFITSASPPKQTASYTESEQIDNYESYEPNKQIPNQQMEPRPLLLPPRHQSGPIDYSMRNPPRLPQEFKLNPTTQSSNSQLQSPSGLYRPMVPPFKPIQNYQLSDNYDIFENRFKVPIAFVPPRQDYNNHYHYEHKRSHGPVGIRTETIMARNFPSSPKPTTSYKPIMKSPPRIIVSASASVSDSNGKKLNYTVGNIVHEVKPIVSINYENYKESDIDPFFLDVPKLNKRNRPRRSLKSLRSKRGTIITAENRMFNDGIPIENLTDSSSTETVITTYITENQSNGTSVKNYNVNETTTTRWEPPEYVDDNYEPYVYDELAPMEVDPPHNKPDKNSIVENKMDNIDEKPDDAEYITLPNAEYLEDKLDKVILFHKVQQIDPKVLLKKQIEFTTTKSKTNTSNLEELEKELQKQLAIFHQVQKENALKKYELEMKLKQQKLQHIYDMRPEELRMESTTSSQMKKSPSEKTKVVKFQTTEKSDNITAQPDIHYRLIKLESQTENSPKHKFSCVDQTFYTFHKDLQDCRIFHLCSPGYEKSQFVNLKFQCDIGLYFDSQSSNCVDKSKSDCF